MQLIFKPWSTADLVSNRVSIMHLISQEQKNIGSRPEEAESSKLGLSVEFQWAFPPL